ncbi:PEP-CTERM sorting domain-containing protein [Methyloglobulus morosus]
MVAQNFSGGAAPEPSTVVGMMLMAVIGTWTLYRRQKHGLGYVNR